MEETEKTVPWMGALDMPEDLGSISGTYMVEEESQHI